MNRRVFSYLLFFACFFLSQALHSQYGPDTARINQLNDKAWKLAKQNPDSALASAELAVQLMGQDGEGYATGMINSQILMGILYKDKGFYGISVEHYHKALAIAEKVKDSLRISGCLNNLGAVYQEQENYPKALEYFQKSLAMEEMAGVDQSQRSIRLFNIGDAYRKMDSLSKAYAFFYNSLAIEEELKNAEGIFYARLGIGQVDMMKGNFTKSEEELKAALNYCISQSNHYGFCESQSALGELYLRLRRFDEALDAFQSVLMRSREFAYQSHEMNALHGLYLLYKQQGNLAYAIENLEAYHEIREKINSNTVKNRIGEMEKRYDLERHQRDLDHLKQQEALDAQTIRYEVKLRNYLLFTVALTALLIGYNFYKHNKLRGTGKR